MSSTHPLILAFGETYNQDFPLVLVIGREPNTETISDGNLGYYDFRNFPRCSFWNVTFSIIGKLHNKTCKDIKEEMTTNNVSPIVFADAFPKGIKNAITQKNKLRQTYLDLAEQQVDAISAHKAIINRVRAIILAGQSDSIYNGFKDLLKKRLDDTDIKIIELPFFYPTNMPKIWDSLDIEDRDLISRIYCYPRPGCQ